MKLLGEQLEEEFCLARICFCFHRTAHNIILICKYFSTVLEVNLQHIWVGRITNLPEYSADKLGKEFDISGSTIERVRSIMGYGTPEQIQTMS